jgi:hypothetical protein
MGALIPRKYERRPFLAGATVHPRGGSPFKGELIDLGRGGAGLFSGRFLPVGQPVEIVVTAGFAGLAVERRFAGRVAHGRVGPEGNLLGIAFDRALAPDELRPLERRR